MTRTAFHIVAVLFLLLIGFLTPLRSQSSKKYWVYFIDKGPTLRATGALTLNTVAYRTALEVVHPKALARRAKVLLPEALLNVDDLPVNESYLTHIQKLGGVLVHTSRWMNAASVHLTPDQVAGVSKLPFVKAVKPVVILHGKSESGQLIKVQTSLR